MISSATTGISGYRFDDITVDIERRRVTRGGTALQLGKLTYEMLVALAEAAPGIIAHEELEKRLWRGRFVNPGNVRMRAKLLRQALSDNVDQPYYLEVVRGQGYRLIPDVERLTGGVSSKGWKLSSRMVAAVAGVSLTIFIGILLSFTGARDATAVKVLPNSVAVLPFENLSPDSDDAYFAVGIHEQVLTQLANIAGLNVISMTSIDRYADGQTELHDIARQLNVETILEGSVRYADDRVRISVRLIEPESGLHLWSEAYERDFAEIFAIQADIAMNIANALEAEFSLVEQARFESMPTDSVAAYALYLKALGTRRGGNSTLSDIAVRDLDAAIALDPEFALAYALRASRYARDLVSGLEVPIAEYERLAIASAEQALALDPTIGLAYSALAEIDDVNWRWAEARRRSELAYHLSPNDATVVSQYLRFTRSSGEYDRSIRENERWVRLDPTSSDFFRQLAVTNRYARNFDAAVTAAERAIEIDPAESSSHLHLAYAEAARGNRARTVSELQITEQLLRSNVDQIFRISQIAMAYSLVDRREDAERMFAVLEERAHLSTVGDAAWALAYLALRDFDQAYRHLEAAIASPSPSDNTTLIEIKANSWSITELEHPRFQQLLSKLWLID